MSDEKDNQNTEAPERTSDPTKFRNQVMLEALKDTMTRTIYAKTEMCKAEPMSDNPPLLLVAYNADAENTPKLQVGDNEKIKMGMIPLIHSDDVRDALIDVIGALPSEQFEFMILAVEGYHDTAQVNGELPENWKRGDLAEDYKTNPFTTVKEGIIVSGVDWEHEYAINGHCTYSYDDKGVPVFDETDMSWSQIEISEETGMMTFIMASACSFMQRKLLAEHFHSLLESTPKKKNNPQ